MKIGLVGYGYWGKIILDNLARLGYNDITICELNDIDWMELGRKYKQVKSYKKLKCDKVFIITPTTTHYEIVKYFLNNGVDVFCEKPLTLSSGECDMLYKYKSQLFVDWIFTYHPAVWKIKEIISKKGKPKNIVANRLNYGPERFDVSARWDLASHDVSILNYILQSNPDSVNWIDFKRNNTSVMNDSAIGILKYDGTTAQINASWEYGKKDRLFEIEFNDGTFLIWDDVNKKLECNFEKIEYENSSPLHNSINGFLNGQSNEIETKEITKVLEI